MKNKYCNYTSSSIIKCFLSLYETMYNDSDHCQITEECMITTNISVIHESVYRVLLGDV